MHFHAAAGKGPSLSKIAIVLILMSALIHAAWNLIAKRISPTAGFFLIANLAGAWIFFPWMIISPGIVHGIDGRVWAFVILTGLFQALYCISLAGAYRHGDLSISYPISRSLPVILVPLAAILLGRGNLLGIWFFLGAMLVLVGGTLVSFDEIRSLKRRFVLSGILPLALCAAIGTTGYSLVDDHALRIIRGDLVGQVYGTVPVTLVYAFLEGLACAAWIGIYILLTGKSSGDNRVPAGWAAGAGVLMYLTYGMVLLAMAYARDVSLIVAFRQVSILIGALMGFTFLRESASIVKILGLTIMFAGLAAVALG